ncbi:MAG: inorganic phosphate transporter [Bacteroidales bacterium]|nr:inorganic phosphate transporter [Bacteroidales bacterium]MDY0215861.1 inorganic phosphate transporter [Bacteroidales bacterium]
MDYIYLVFVVVLFVLAISDLIVGVSNDAVNFLNSAIGAKAAPINVIMIVASLGILVGVTFSSGMMEVARNGIFNPHMFSFAEIMIIFLAVMITDVILLDFFNSIGLPTSTTVSIVFELLGASVAIAMVKVAMSDSETAQNIGEYINSAKALAIIGGIFLSVFLSFFVGAIVQYISRLIFSFRYRQNLKWAGSIFGGIAISAIIYFIIIKGMKDATYIPSYIMEYVKMHSLIILGVTFVFFTVLLQILYLLFKTNAPRIIVIVGTFAMALAFAGNDLVNFVGVPLAGLASYQAWAASGVEASDFMMSTLTQPVQSGIFILLGSGAIMIITLWTSSKAKSVIATTVDLSRQDEGFERFSSTAFSRVLVRMSVNFNNQLSKVIPQKIRSGIESRFQLPETANDPENPAFDMIRAAVNLSVASILIAMATSFKLPLSTTYVAFMVAMGTSLADRAWGRDSAVYRITGVFTVISGWFLTAFMAFTATFLIGLFLYYTNIVGIIIMLLVAGFLIVKTHISHKKGIASKVKNEIKENQEFIDSKGEYINKCNNAVKLAIIKASKIYYVSMIGLIEEDRKQLKSIKNEVKDYNTHVKDLKDNLYQFMQNLNKLTPETGHYYVQVLDYMREMSRVLNFIVEPIYEHVSNNHKALVEAQKEELKQIIALNSEIFNQVIHMVKEMKYDEIAHIISDIEVLIRKIEGYKKAQIKRIKKREVNTRNSILYLGLMQESKNLLMFVINLIKAQRDFVIFTKDQK